MNGSEGTTPVTDALQELAPQMATLVIGIVSLALIYIAALYAMRLMRKMTGEDESYQSRGFDQGGEIDNR